MDVKMRWFTYKYGLEAHAKIKDKLSVVLFFVADLYYEVV